jgi:hypothetical protein
MSIDTGRAIIILNVKNSNRNIIERDLETFKVPDRGSVNPTPLGG